MLNLSKKRKIPLPQRSFPGTVGYDQLSSFTWRHQNSKLKNYRSSWVFYGSRWKLIFMQIFTSKGFVGFVIQYTYNSKLCVTRHLRVGGERCRVSLKSQQTCTVLNLLFHWSPLICTSIVFRDRGIVMWQSLLFSQLIKNSLSNRCGIALKSDFWGGGWGDLYSLTKFTL